MKYLIIGLCLVSVMASGQTRLQKSITLQGEETVQLNFKYPNVIRISGWEQPHIEISGTAMINNGQHDDAFILKTSTSGGVLEVTSEIEGHDTLPKKISIKKDGVTYFFDTDNMHDPEVVKFKVEHGSFDYSTHGVIKEIVLEIKVPRGVKVAVNAKYGVVEVANLSNPLLVDAKYGGIDITYHHPFIITARTRFGEIYTDLDDHHLKQVATHNGHYDKWTTVNADLGGGKTCSLESKFGNLYLRKAK